MVPTFFHIIGDVAGDLEQQLLGYVDDRIGINIRRGWERARIANWSDANGTFAELRVFAPDKASAYYSELIIFARNNGLFVAAPTSDNVKLMPEEIERTTLLELLPGFIQDPYILNLGITNITELQKLEFADIIRLHQEYKYGRNWASEVAVFSFMLRYKLNFYGSNLVDDLGIPVEDCIFGRTHAERNILMRSGILWLNLLQHVSEEELLESPYRGHEFGRLRLANIKRTLAAHGLTLKA